MDVFKGVLGRGIDDFSETLMPHKMTEKKRRKKHGMMSFKQIQYYVTQTYREILIGMMLFFNQLYVPNV